MFWPRSQCQIQSSAFAFYHSANDVILRHWHKIMSPILMRYDTGDQAPTNTSTTLYYGTVVFLQFGALDQAPRPSVICLKEKEKNVGFQNLETNSICFSIKFRIGVLSNVGPVQLSYFIFVN